jgi:hypothetical protein
MSMYALLLERSDQVLHHAVPLRAVRCDELLPQSAAAHERGVAARGEHQPERSRRDFGTRPRVPERAIRACSKTDSAVLDRPLRERCRPKSPRLRQSMIRASVAQPSRPLHTRHKSVAQNSFGTAATEGMACTRGRKPTGIVPIISLPRPAGTAFFSGTQFQHRLAVRFLQILQLLLVLLPRIRV